MPLPFQNAVRSNRGSAVSGFARSQNIWHDCPWDSILNGEIAGHCQYIGGGLGAHGLITSPTTEAALVGLPLSGFGSSGSTITTFSAPGGGLVLTEATDNEGNYIRASNCPFLITKLGGKLWFEMRIKQNQGAVAAGTAIGANVQNWIGGLWSDVACSAVVPLSAANPPIMATTGDFVGFRMPEAGSGVVTFGYDTNDADQTVDGEVVTNASVATMTNGTFINLGFVFDPLDEDRINTTSPGAATLSYFVNNIRGSSFKTIPDATATDFPATKQLGLMCGQLLGASTSTLLTIQWMRCAQLGV